MFLGGAALVVGALAIALVGRGWSSRPDDGAAEALAWQVAGAVEAALRGEPFDPRFLGGYSDSDLRAAEGVVELPPDAEATLVAFGLTQPRQGWAIIRRGESSIVWAQRQRPEHPTMEATAETLEAADPGIAALAARAGMRGCLPSPEEDALARPPLAALGPLLAEPLCTAPRREPTERRPVVGRRSRAGSARGEPGGAIDRYVVVFEGGGDSVAVGGVLHAHTGRPWLGNPTRWPPSPQAP